jgi:hypothetical protein
MKPLINIAKCVSGALAILFALMVAREFVTEDLDHWYGDGRDVEMRERIMARMRSEVKREPERGVWLVRL